MQPNNNIYGIAFMPHLILGLILIEKLHSKKSRTVYSMLRYMLENCLPEVLLSSE
ncbi:MAG: hypothetical protein HUJ51_03395 [Eggerthellaceae bacterium]|nr:hypothetical protein [Eggerthellaceae bacterium]